MFVHFNAQSFQFLFICHNAGLTVELGQHHTAYIKTVAAESIDQAEYIHIVCDAQIASYFILFNITCTDDDDDFRLIFQMHQHIDLTVRLEAGQNTGCMVVIEQFAAEFQIQFATKLGNALFDMLRLQFQVFIIIKSDS